VSSSSTGRAAPPSSPDGLEGCPPPDHVRETSPGRLRRPRWGGNPYATTALVTGVLGAALITIPVSLVSGVLGLLRARRGGPGAPGKLRSWLGIGFALGWAAVAGFLVPHLVRAADPGCVTYKGPALVAYQKVIEDFSEGTDDATTARDLVLAIHQLDGAAAESQNQAASRSFAGVSAQLQTVLSDVRARTPVPHTVLQTLNHDSALADDACGTVRL
jgi:hypothetical protein